MTKAETLSVKQRLFCFYQARTDDPVEAAVRAGFPPRSAGYEALKLLDRADVRTEVERYRREARDRSVNTALAGLCRLAAGGIGDVAKLVCRSALPDEEELASMDLFAVSELRKGKDGGLEVKLYDRLRALELLLTYRGGEEEAGSFYSALDAAVSAMSGPIPLAGGEERAV